MTAEMLVLAGVLVSIIIEVAQRLGKLNKLWTYAVTLAAALIGGGIFVLIKDTAYWPTTWEILKVASVVYAFIMRNWPES